MTRTLKIGTSNDSINTGMQRRKGASLKKETSIFTLEANGQTLKKLFTKQIRVTGRIATLVRNDLYQIGVGIFFPSTKSRYDKGDKLTT